MDRNVFCTELVELEKAFPNLMAGLTGCDSRLLSALSMAHNAYTDKTVSEAEQAQLDALKIARVQLDKLDMVDAVKGIDKQIQSITGDYAEKAWRAYRAHLSANGSSSTSTTSTRDPFEGIVVRCPFGSGYTLFVQVKNGESYAVWKVTQGDQKEIVELPAFLEGYVLTSLSSIRKLAWAIKSEKSPTMCKDGIGQRKKDLEGGTLAEIVSHSPAAWETEQRKINSAKTVKTTQKAAKAA